MKSRALFATALLFALPTVCSFAAEEATPPHPQESIDPASIADTLASMDAHVVPDNLQAVRKPDELLFSEIKILPSF